MAMGPKDRNLANVSLVGRILLSAIFILSGFGKIMNFQATHQLMASRGIPLTSFFLVGAILIEVGAGIAVLLGLQARWAATMLLVYMVPVTFIFHGFWGLENPERQMQMIGFLKNMAIMGGLVQIIALGPGPISVDESGYHRRLGEKDTSIRLRRVS